MAQVVRHLGDGRWWDEARQTWRDGRGREVPSPCPGRGAAGAGRPRWCWRRRISTTTPAHCGRRHRNVRALCQRCHLLHDRPEHRRRIRLTLRRRRALGDLFSGPYSALVIPAQPEKDPVKQHAPAVTLGRSMCSRRRQ